MEGMDHYIFDWGWGVGNFFLQKYLFVTNHHWRPSLEFYFTSLQYTYLLCAAMHDIYFFGKSCAGNFFAFAQPPLENKMVRQAETRQCYLSHTVSALAFSIISYRHAARNVFVQFY